MRRSILLALICLAAACRGPLPNPAPLLSPTWTNPAPTRLSLVPSPGELPIGGGTARIHIETVAGYARVAAHVPVSIEASEGSLSATQVTTDNTGHAVVEWTGTRTTRLTARAGEGLEETVELRVHTPPVLPPPSTPRPPSPPPPPLPQPPPPLALPTVQLAASAPTVPAGGTLTFTATVSGLSGESVRYYQWDLDGDGSEEATTTSGVRTSAPYTGHGPVTTRVIVTTTSGRVASGGLTIIVTN